jgi:glycerol-3-phosphate dehydrogenase
MTVHSLGDTDVRLVSTTVLYEMEPHLAPGALGAVFVPGEVLVDPWLIPIAYAHHAIVNGGRLHLKACVTQARFDSTKVIIHFTT